MSLIGVLSNARSTRNQACLGRIRDVVEDFDGIFHFEITDIADVSLALKRFAEQGVDLIALNGGDGTIQAAFSCLLRERPFTVMPPIAVLPAGRTNMIAEDLGATSPKPYVYLRRLLELNRDGRLAARLTRRHILRVEGLPDIPELYGMFLGTAGIVQAIEFCRRKIYPLGLPNGLSHPLAVGLMLLGTLFGGVTRRSPFTTPPIGVKIDGAEGVAQQYLLIAASTLDRLILGLRLTSKEGRGAVRLLMVPQRPGSMLTALARVLTGKLGQRSVNGIQAVNADDARFRLGCAVTVDGELYDMPPETELRVSATDAFQFVHFGVPAPS